MPSLTGMRVCHVTSNHPAEDDRIFFKEARSLARAGADVTLLCSDVTRAPVDTFGIKYATYPGGGSIRRRLITIGELEKALMSSEFDVIHCHEPDALVAALRVKAARSVKVIFDSHEMWGATLAQRFPSWMWGGVEGAFRAVERRWLAKCDWGLGATWRISDYLAESLGRDKVATILNVPDTKLFALPVRKTWDGEITFCHDGHLNFDRGLVTMVEAFRLVSTRHNVRFKIVGDVYAREREWLDQVIEKYGLQGKIVRTGWLPYKEVGAALAPCHIGLIALTRRPNNEYSLPNKLFNYLLYGMPFIGPEFCFDQRALVERNMCGRLVDPSNVGAFAEAMSWFVENRKTAQEMGDMAGSASANEYTWEHMEARLLDVYARMQ